MIPSKGVVWVLSLGLMLALVSCMGRGPIQPAPLQSGNKGSNGITTSYGPTNRSILGYWKFAVSADRSSVKLVPVRSTELHLNVVKLLEGKACEDCLKIENFAVSSSDVLFCDVTLTHPFPGLDKYTGFDVRGIVVSGSDYTFPISGKTISWIGDHIKLLSPDGYTSVFNPTEFPSDKPGPDALKYIKGKMSTGGSLTATLNPFIAFMRDSERRNFAPGKSETKKFMLKLVPGKLEFGYIVDACWAPVAGPITDPIKDFPPEGKLPGGVSDLYAPRVWTHECHRERGIGSG